MSHERPMPIPDADSAPFWESCSRGVLTAQRCPSCAAWRWPPAAWCPECRAPGGDWIELSGTGTVTTYVIVHRSFDPAFEVPYVIAHVALDGTDGRCVLRSNVVGGPAHDVAVGMEVTVDFDESPPLPLFRPRRQSA